MNYRILLGLLALSVGANGVLLLQRTRPAASTTEIPSAAGAAGTRGSPAVGASAAPGAPAAVAAATPIVWKNPGTGSDQLRAFAAELRAAGFPPHVVTKFVGALLRERTQADLAALPYWKLLGGGAEVRKLQFAAGAELLRLQEEILGPSGSAVATLDPVRRRLEYGDLPDAKVAALMRIERDYQELSLGLNSFSGSVTMEEMKARNEQRAVVEKERLADIAAALTPEEFAAWELRSSGGAQRVQFGLRNLEVTEEEYRALVAAQKAFEPNATMFFSSMGGDARLPERHAMLAQVRTTLGDERFDTYLRNTDFNYASTAAFVEKQPGLTKDKAYALYQLQLEAQELGRAQSTRAQANGGRPDVNQLRKDWSALNERLDALIGADAAQAYRKQGAGGLFNNFRTMPRASGTPGTPAAPAIALPAPKS